jgi:hypothetical protein
MEHITAKLLFAEDYKVPEEVLGPMKRKRGRPRKVIRDPTIFHYKCKHKPHFMEDEGSKENGNVPLVINHKRDFKSASKIITSDNKK